MPGHQDAVKAIIYSYSTHKLRKEEMELSFYNRAFSEKEMEIKTLSMNP